MANLREENVSFCGDLFFIEIQEGERGFVFVFVCFGRIGSFPMWT